MVEIYTGTASRSKNASLKQRTIASEIPLDQLRVSPLQLKQLKEIHQRHATTIDDGISPVDYLYGVGDDDQLAAITIMVHQGLDIDARERLDNRWSLQWSRSSGKSAKTAGKGFNARQSMWLSLVPVYRFQVSDQ
ncbi:hypothetical protein B0H17DRAFT_1197667 [Mycena rosella]|uniref:Uncharacterized protein n=1 Tax=Mycena rosella TaxID=1033263 RepID=A0AAD7DPY0_MYCRO|nr:hypothetical protein B0H17DRAFT_1197667 [Mycena rosella]